MCTKISSCYVRAPRAPLLTVLERGRTTAYPLELCFVKDNQRVNLSQLAPRDVATMIKVCLIAFNVTFSLCQCFIPDKQSFRPAQCRLRR